MNDCHQDLPSFQAFLAWPFSLNHKERVTNLRISSEHSKGGLKTIVNKKKIYCTFHFSALRSSKLTPLKVRDIVKKLGLLLVKPFT